MMANRDDWHGQSGNPVYVIPDAGSLGVVRKPVRSFRLLFLGLPRETVFLVEPAVAIDHLTSNAAEGHRRALLGVEFDSADGASHSSHGRDQLFLETDFSFFDALEEELLAVLDLRSASAPFR